MAFFWADPFGQNGTVAGLASQISKVPVRAPVVMIQRTASAHLISTRPSTASSSAGGPGGRRPSPQRPIMTSRQNSKPPRPTTPSKSAPSTPSRGSLNHPSSFIGLEVEEEEEEVVAVATRDDGEAQTSVAIGPMEDAVFVTLDELRQIKEEKDGLEALVRDSMDTIEIIKQKYQDAKVTNSEMVVMLEDLGERYRNTEEERDRLRREVEELRIELQASRRTEQLAASRLEERSHLPTDVLEAAKAIARSDAELKTVHEGCLSGIRELTEMAYDCLVGIESDESELLRRFPSVSFVKKEEIDPYKGVPKRVGISTSTGPAFAFGSPSQRFPLTPQGDDQSDHSDHSEQSSARSRLDSEATSDVSDDEQDRHVGLETSYESEVYDETGESQWAEGEYEEQIVGQDEGDLNDEAIEANHVLL